MPSQDSPDSWLSKPTLSHAAADGSAARAEAAALKPGDRLAAYELLAPLGKGGMGTVFRARHVHLKKEFAVKVLSPWLARAAEATRRFERETEALGRLEHVHLVRASDAGVENGVPFVVMELLDGMDLSALTKQCGPWPRAEACEAVRQAALGLQHAHERGLVHRDIKPSNLWLTPAGVVKVLDLGLARLCDDDNGAAPMTFAGSWMGTPDYVAPEQILDSHTADIRADLYSLGCTLFYLLSGEPPFGPTTHPTVRDKSEAHLTEPPPDIRQRRPDVPAELADVLARLLAKQPEDRYSTPAETAAALAPFASGACLPALLSGETVAAPPFVSTRCEKAATTLASAPRHRAGRRHRRWAVVLVSAALFGLLIFWVLARLRPRPDAPSVSDAIVTEKVRVLRLEVMHYPTLNGESAPPRPLGEKSFATHLNDSVTVKSRLSRPAYAFVIAFRPDGTSEVCFPEKENEPPPVTDRPRYPSVSLEYNYRLEEGVGLQVFAVVVSSEPLPSFKEWWARCAGCPWQKHEAPAGVVWRANGIDDVEPLSELNAAGQRGKRMEVPGKTPVARLAAWLRTMLQVEAVEVVGFAVMAKEKP